MAGIDAADRRTRYQRLHSALNNRQDRSVPQRFDIDPGHGAKLASRDARRNIAGSVSFAAAASAAMGDDDCRLAYFGQQAFQEFHLIGKRYRCPVVDIRRAAGKVDRMAGMTGGRQAGRDSLPDPASLPGAMHINPISSASFKRALPD
jgi:hypothetical protein